MGVRINGAVGAPAVNSALPRPGGPGSEKLGRPPSPSHSTAVKAPVVFHPSGATGDELALGAASPSSASPFTMRLDPYLPSCGRSRRPPAPIGERLGRASGGGLKL